MATPPEHTSRDKPKEKLKYGTISPYYLPKTNIGNSIPSSPSKSTKLKNNSLYPYLTGDKVQVLSRVTEKRLVHKTTTDYVSSFPLAANLYKASSDEFKHIKKFNKKVKKSVLTLPNDPAPLPQLCTVSDMNDSEYCSRNETLVKKKNKKRHSIKNIRKTRIKEKDYEFYDRDARYCSQLNVNLDCSSTDMIKHYKGDGKRSGSKMKPCGISAKLQSAEKNNGHNIWAILSNMNRFQFRPSPAISLESLVTTKQIAPKKRSNKKDTRVIETRTEEFAYISNFELDNQGSRPFSRSSSFGRITVIDKDEEFHEICGDFEKKYTNIHPLSSGRKKKKHKIKKHFGNNGTLKRLGNKENNNEIVTCKANVLTCKVPNRKHKDKLSLSSSDYRRSLSDVENVFLSKNSDEFKPTRPKKKIAEPKAANHNTYHDNFNYCGNLGASKAELAGVRNVKNDNPLDGRDMKESDTFVRQKKYPKDTDEFIINSIATNLLVSQTSKSRVMPRTPSPQLMPKLTQTEIKRRLSRLKSPVVILEKDQVNSEITVSNYNPPQFFGLDKQVWPYMVCWLQDYEKNKKELNTCENIKPKNALNIKLNSLHLGPNLNKSRKEITTFKATTGLKDLSHTNITNTNQAIVQKQTESVPRQPKSLTVELPKPRKPKAICQLKDKMLNFLYKKSSSRDVTQDNISNDKGEIPIFQNNIDINAHIQIGPYMVYKNMMDKDDISAQLNMKKTKHNGGYPWAKAKWASDFVENVIKKIRHGAYYSIDSKNVISGCQYGLRQTNNFESNVAIKKTQCLKKIGNLEQNKRIQRTPNTNSSSYFDASIIASKNPGLKETGIQVGSTSIQVTNHVVQTTGSDSKLSTKVIRNGTRDITSPIPGFNNSLPALEIKTLNMNQIAIKHCMTNVMVQFDITVPANTCEDNLDKTPSLMALEVSESNTKIFKCKTSILNAMLPAELCSILPKLLNSFKELNFTAALTLETPVNNSCLSTITELTSYDSSSPFRSLLASYDNTIVSPNLRRFFGGIFSVNYEKCNANRKNNILNHKVLPNLYLIMGLFPKLSVKHLLCNEASLPIESIHFHAEHKSEMRTPNISSWGQSSTCKALDIYCAKSKRLIPAFTHHNLMSIMSTILRNINLKIDFKLSSYLDVQKLSHGSNNVTLNITMKSREVEKNMIISFSNTSQNSYAVNSIENCSNCLENKADNKYNMIVGNKTKKKGSHKVHRKCKSTTNLPSGDKSPNTLLSRVTNIEDFCQILGSKKTYSSVLDGYAGKKILSSVIEMKNWITEISPQQALLILLLTNKKDTANLVRFRPIILQGIAVNRITRASELDMEIEVIERENLNKIAQHEGISYLPESIESYDTLMEELYWIAKTTASDYQRPFDESSEKLLRSLLEKRKKLNPSYLRVMARYVGLGLLKSPVKN